MEEYKWTQTKSICIFGLSPENAIEKIQKLVQDVPKQNRSDCVLGKGQDYDDLVIRYKREMTKEDKDRERKEKIAFLQKHKKLIQKQLDELSIE